MIDVAPMLSSGTTSGGAGASTSNNTGLNLLTGLLLGFFVRYNGTPPATTDVTIEAVGGVLPTRTLLVLTNINTSDFYAVRQPAVLRTSGVAITDSNTLQPLFNDKLKITVAQANDGNSVDIWAVFQR